MNASDTGLGAVAALRTRHNEDQVLATRGLESERRVTAVRLLTLMMMGISQGLVSSATGHGVDDGGGVRPVALVLYFTFAISTFFIVRRQKTSPRRATVMPLLSTTADVCFLLAMSWADVRAGELQLDGCVGSLMLVISYALLRFSTSSLVYSVVGAVVAFALVLSWAGPFDWPRFTFSAFLFVALGTLLWWTRRAVRTAFVDLQRREGLSRLLPQKVVEEILAGREELLRPTRRDVSVLFSDVRDFTSSSEDQAPEDVLRFLDDYFGRMTAVVQGHDGSVNKFIGDGLLAVWGAPNALDDHAVRAVKAGLDMQKVVQELNVARAAAGLAPVVIGVGVHSGLVAAGMLGGGGQSEFTVIGDTVNLASRIEGLTKQHAGGVLVSDETWQRLGGRFTGTCVGEATVKGRKAPVVLWTVTAVSA